MWSQMGPASKRQEILPSAWLVGRLCPIAGVSPIIDAVNLAVEAQV